MIVERAHLLKIENSKVQREATSRLDVYFDGRDLDLLADPSIGYLSNRFMECNEDLSIEGWAAEDKVHVNVRTPVSPDENEKVAELQLDPGGDLYFTIWNSLALRAYQPIEFAAVAPFVTSDPNDRLGQAGIKAVCLHQLLDLSDELADRERRSNDHQSN
jgi:hypothetical protein